MTTLRDNCRASLRSRPRDRSAFTLIETVLSLSITAILMAGIGLALSLAGRSVNAGATADTPALEGTRALRDVTSDLNIALLFSERTDKIVEFTVPDRDGDGEVDLIRYEWSGTPGHPLERWTNGNGPVVAAANVHALDFSYLLETRGAPPLPPEVESPEVELFAHDDDPGGQEIPDRYAAEVARLESWGYTVTPIDATSTAAEFDAAVPTASVVVIPPGIDEAVLGTKLRQAAIGVVCEAAGLTDEMGLTDTPAELIPEVDKIKVLSDDNPHYITDPISDGDRTIVDVKQTLVGFPGDLGAATFHAKHRDIPKDPALAVINAGDDLEGPGGGTAPARRVFMPWGGADFDHAALNAEGETILSRAVEWGQDGAPGNTVLFVVEGLGTGLNEVRLVEDAGPALYVPPPDFPTNVLAWSISRVLIVAGQHGPDLNGEIDLAITLPNPDQTPSTLTLWSETQFDESNLSAVPVWIEFTVGIDNLVPDEGVCVEVIGHEATNAKRDARIGYETNDGFLEAGPLWMTTTDHGATWTPPDANHRMRIYVYGTYTTIGPPLW